MSYYRQGLVAPARGVAFEKHHYAVGALFHSVGDREDMVRKLDAEFTAAHSEAMLDMGWTPQTPSAVEADPRWTWYRMALLPTYDAWKRFRDQLLGSWAQRFTTSWDTIESWQNRLLGYRQALEGKDFALATPDPEPLNQTMWEAARDTTGNAIAGVANFVKNVAYVLLFLAGGFVLYKIIAVRSGASPVLGVGRF